MKTVQLSILMLLLPIWLNAEVSYELIGHISPLEADYEFVCSQMMDVFPEVTGSEILVTYAGKNEWQLAVYDQSGNLLEKYSAVNPSRWPIENSYVFKIDTTIYIVSVHFTGYPHFELELRRIYDWKTMDVKHINLSIYGFIHDRGVPFIKGFIHEDKYFVSLGCWLDDEMDDPGYEERNHLEQNFLFKFSDDSLEFIQDYKNCLHLYYPGNIAWGRYSHSSWSDGGGSFSSAKRYFYSVRWDDGVPQLTENDNLAGKEYLSMLTDADSLIDTFGMVFSYARYDEENSRWNRVFTGFDREVAEQTWYKEKNFNQYINSSINLSSNVKLGTDDYYVLYFIDDWLEIRDRRNGAIFLSERNPFIPIAIMRGQQDSLYFLEELSSGSTTNFTACNNNSDGYNIYKLIGAVTAIEQQKRVADSEILLSNYPNPFNSETKIKYILPPENVHYSVRINIFNSNGQLVIELKSELSKPGIYTAVWKGQNKAGQSMPSGVYFCMIKANQFKAVQKMFLVR